MEPTALPQDRMYDITIGQHCRRQLKIHPHSINPHTDIASTGKYEVFSRDVPLYIRGDEHGTGNMVETPMVCIYQPDGRCSHMLPPDLAAVLHQRFNYMQQHHAGKMQKLKAGTFAEELHKLASRYSEGTVCSLKEGQYKIEAKHQRALPLALRTTLQGIVGCTKERFSSPLAVHPGTADYWTVHTQDQVFGARCDAYKAQWTGCSIACPDYQAEHAARAVTWAIQSAIHTNVPTLTLLVLPTYNKDTSSTAHMRWIKKFPEQCKILATLPRSLTKLQIPPNTRQPPATP